MHCSTRLFYIAYVIFITDQGICRELALVDMIEDKLKGEMLDLQHCQRFVKNVSIRASTGINYFSLVLCGLIKDQFHV